ncbi:hypothetical protein ABTQ23_11495 [Celerinatantimonas sp. MCCC 1A17872]
MSAFAMNRILMAQMKQDEVANRQPKKQQPKRSSKAIWLKSAYSRLMA